MRRAGSFAALAGVVGTSRSNTIFKREANRGSPTSRASSNRVAAVTVKCINRSPSLVSYSADPEEPPEDVWFAYYKDTRKQGGRLKMGYGPGGPPVFSAEEVLDLVEQMVKRGCLDAGKVRSKLGLTTT